MSSNIYASFDQFIAKYQKAPSSPNRSITSQRISNILNALITENFPESSSAFDNEYFRQILLQLAETIINLVYRKQQHYSNIDQIITYANIIQYITHNGTIELPQIIKVKMQRYFYSLVYLQNCLKMKTIHDDSLNSVTISSFYKSVYMSAFQFRYRELMRQFGFVERSFFLAMMLLRDVVQKSQYDIERYESSVTSEWITLSLVYFILASKYESMKQIPVLSKILERYHNIKVYDYAFRKIDGNQLCHFYNNFVVDRIKKVQNYEIDKMIDETTVEHEIVVGLLVSPIQNDNNTILDNCIFSSSWEP